MNCKDCSNSIHAYIKPEQDDLVRCCQLCNSYRFMEDEQLDLLLNVMCYKGEIYQMGWAKASMLHNGFFWLESTGFCDYHNSSEIPTLDGTFRCPCCGEILPRDLLDIKKEKVNALERV